MCEPLAYVLAKLGFPHVMAVHSKDDLDEFSLATGTHDSALKDGKVHTYLCQPDVVGIVSKTLNGRTVNDQKHSLETKKNAWQVFQGFIRGSTFRKTGALVGKTRGVLAKEPANGGKGILPGPGENTGWVFFKAVLVFFVSKTLRTLRRIEE
ncbi:hypothetical protein CPI13_02460, partial [Moraxella catarrhalis]|nr:hypothetical protein [Moraxella catarrhalis]